MKQILKNTARALGVTRPRAAAARLCAERYALAVKPRAQARIRAGGRILCYHSIGQPETGSNDVSPHRFRQHLHIALQSGRRFVPAAQIAAGRGEPHDLAITFDDGWSSTLTGAAPILKEFGAPWTLFIVSNWSAHSESWTRNAILGWREVEKLAAEGVEIGSHSMSHPDFAKISAGQIADELSGSRETIAAHLGVKPTAFAIPLGLSVNWPEAAAKAARAAGYEVVYAQAETTRPAGTVARSFVTKFDDGFIFRALLDGAYDEWEEWA